MPAGRNRQRAGKRTQINVSEARVLEYGAKQIESALYDFDEDGGDNTAAEVDFNTQLPENAVVTDLYADVLTAVTGNAGATYELKANGQSLMTATTFDDATDGLDSTGLVKISVAQLTKLTDDGSLTLDIAVDDLTAGKVRFTVEYYVAVPAAR